MSDLIDRQAAIDAAKHAWAKGLEPSQYIELLPPVQPKRGKWIERRTWSEGYGMGESYGKYWACDQCGREVKGFWNECGNNFCSNCGADMRERGEAE